MGSSLYKDCHANCTQNGRVALAEYGREGPTWVVSNVFNPAATTSGKMERGGCGGASNLAQVKIKRKKTQNENGTTQHR